MSSIILNHSIDQKSRVSILWVSLYFFARLKVMENYDYDDAKLISPFSIHSFIQDSFKIATKNKAEINQQ